MAHGERFKKLVDEARSRIQETDVDTVKAMLDRGDSFHLIDVREQSEWDVDHLPEAKHLCKGVIEVKIESVVPNVDDKIVLYCGGGYRSALAADNLKKMGYTDVISMDGGYRDWHEKNYPLVKDA